MGSPELRLIWASSAPGCNTVYWKYSQSPPGTPRAGKGTPKVSCVT